MPSTSDRIRAKFMADGDDGIGKAEEMIAKSGGRIERGMITPPDPCDDEDVLDAIRYLVEEWDYGIMPDQEPGSGSYAPEATS